MERTLLCIARGRDGDWEANCIDLDIAVQGESFDEVRQLLGEAIRTYLKDAMAESDEDRARLLSRRAPFSVRLGYAARVAWATLTNRRHRDGGDLHGSFELPCHA